MKLWSGRFTKSTDQLTDKFTASLPWDLRLYSYDVNASIAHVNMLAAQKIITDDDSDKIKDGLNQIFQDIENGKLTFNESDEDIHMAIERELTERIGVPGGKMHTARSRNDQVLTDMHLYIKDEISDLKELITEFQKALLKMAEDNKDVILPGYTHLQKAQPILFGHFLMAYFFMFERDKSRLEDSNERTDVLPLGSGALAGTTFNIDRERVAKELGFKEISKNTIDTVSSRDFLLELLSALTIMGLNFSRLAEDLIIYSTEEFGYLEMDDAFATGSSLMPQKKNADVAELIRGKSGQLIGSFVSLATVLKGLPLAYNRDLQEDKQSTFQAIDTAKAMLIVATEMVPKMKINKEKMLTAAENSYINATDLADYLVEKGIAFREAHSLVGKIVKDALENGVYLKDISLEDYKKYNQHIEDDVYMQIDVRTSVERHDSDGATSSKQLQKQIKTGYDLVK
ncbi:MAG TPA: argininosuccinate lyase [Actinobacteria bacterium]|nr:argininosuccinate lyase [Actinomycetota bacterium]